jgi:hypothetical protein
MQRHPYEWPILAENHWPNHGRKLTGWPVSWQLSHRVSPLRGITMSLPKAVQLAKFRFWPVLDGSGPGCTTVTLTQQCQVRFAQK